MRQINTRKFTSLEKFFLYSNFCKMCILIHMRTNIDLDDDLIREAQKLCGIHQKRALVHEALKVFIQVKKRLPLSDLRGKIKFHKGFDYKKAREDA